MTPGDNMLELSKRDKDEQLAPAAPHGGIFRSPGSGPVKGE